MDRKHISERLSQLTPDQRSKLSKLLAARQSEKQGRTIPSISRQGRLPVSFGQEQMWLLDQLDPGSPMYNITFPFRVRGARRLALSGQVLDALLARHEILRATICADDTGQPIQTVPPVGRVRLSIVDLGGLNLEHLRSQA